MEKKGGKGGNLVQRGTKLVLAESFCFATFCLLLGVRSSGVGAFLGFIGLISLFFSPPFSSDFAPDVA